MASTASKPCSPSSDPVASPFNAATTADGKIEVIGTWKNGAKGIYREDKKFHGLARGEKGEAPAGSFDGYVPLVVEIMKFFKTGALQVSPKETMLSPRSFFSQWSICAAPNGTSGSCCWP